MALHSTVLDFWALTFNRTELDIQRSNSAGLDIQAQFKGLKFNSPSQVLGLIFNGPKALGLIFNGPKVLGLIFYGSKALGLIFNGPKVLGLIFNASKALGLIFNGPKAMGLAFHLTILQRRTYFNYMLVCALNFD